MDLDGISVCVWLRRAKKRILELTALAIFNNSGSRFYSVLISCSYMYEDGKSFIIFAAVCVI